VRLPLERRLPVDSPRRGLPRCRRERPRTARTTTPAWICRSRPRSRVRFWTIPARARRPVASARGAPRSASTSPCGARNCPRRLAACRVGCLRGRWRPGRRPGRGARMDPAAPRRCRPTRPAVIRPAPGHRQAPPEPPTRATPTSTRHELPPGCAPPWRRRRREPAPGARRRPPACDRGTSGARARVPCSPLRPAPGRGRAAARRHRSELDGHGVRPRSRPPRGAQARSARAHARWCRLRRQARSPPAISPRPARPAATGAPAPPLGAGSRSRASAATQPSAPAERRRPCPGAVLCGRRPQLRRATSAGRTIRVRASCAGGRPEFDRGWRRVTSSSEKLLTRNQEPCG
jgi:hypothetical protein